MAIAEFARIQLDATPLNSGELSYSASCQDLLPPRLLRRQPFGQPIESGLALLVGDFVGRVGRHHNLELFGRAAFAYAASAAAKASYYQRISAPTLTPCRNR